MSTEEEGTEELGALVDRPYRRFNIAQLRDAAELNGEGVVAELEHRVGPAYDALRMDLCPAHLEEVAIGEDGDEVCSRCGQH